MAYLIGTAANHVDLLEQIITFVTTDSTLIADGENWEVLRKAGVKNISASSFVVTFEPWLAFKGPFHDHDNGWSTASGQHANSWLAWDMFEARDITRLKLKGSTTVSQSPNTFRLEWYDETYSVWRIRASWSGITWVSSGEVKEFVLPTWSDYDISGTPTDLSGPKIKWRIFVVSNNGSATFTTILDVQIPEFQNSVDFDYSRRPAVWLKAPGMTGLDPVYTIFQIYDRPTDDYYNIGLTGATGYLDDSDITNQPGAYSPMCLPLWNQSMPFWLSVNGQRLTIAVKVDTKYMPLYIGKILTFGTPLQFPYPLFISAPSSGTPAIRYSAITTLSYKGNNVSTKLRNSAGSWVQPFCHPYSTFFTFRDTSGSYPLLPITLYTTTEVNTYGILDGVHHVSGFSNSAENIIEIGAEQYVAIPSPEGPGINNFFAMRIA